MEAKESDEMQWNLQCDIVRAAYEFAMKNDNEQTRRYMEERMDSYGLERTS
jgi:hypothetical protein